MYITILGRQPQLGIAELERVYGARAVRPLSPLAASVETDQFELARLGGALKAGKVIVESFSGDWNDASRQIVQHFARQWATFDGKITLGISAYGFKTTARDIQKTGIILKQKLKKSGISLRLIPNTDLALSTATSHHNKLGLSPNKVELLVVRSTSGKIFIAQSSGAQNITAYTRRDRERPKRDAFVGMLPPKLAQIMINLAIGRWKMEDGASNTAANESRTSLEGDVPGGGEASSVISRQSRSDTDFSEHLQPEADREPGPLLSPGAKPFWEIGGREGAPAKHILDPFCGTGVILQEAALMGYSVYGTDLSEKMIRFSRDNLNWLANSHHIRFDWYLHEGDAMNTKWQQPINAIVAETYLGQPFSAPPSPSKLAEVRRNCDHIITEFLRNLAPQIASGTPICIAIPAWRDSFGNFTHLALDSLPQLGYTPVTFTHVKTDDLLYYRPDQIVARELLVLTRS